MSPKQAANAMAIRSALGVGKCLGRALAAEAPNGSVATSDARPFAIDGLALKSSGFMITVSVIILIVSLSLVVTTEVFRRRAERRLEAPAA